MSNQYNILIRALPRPVQRLFIRHKKSGVAFNIDLDDRDLHTDIVIHVIHNGGLPGAIRQNTATKQHSSTSRMKTTSGDVHARWLH